MKENQTLIRTSYWVAAIADFVIAILVLFPERMSVTDFVYPMGLMSAVAFSWGVLLIIADQKPIERKWVLLPTILVVFLLGVVGIYALAINLLPLGRIITNLAVTTVVLTLLIVTVIKTREL